MDWTNGKAAQINQLLFKEGSVGSNEMNSDSHTGPNTWRNNVRQRTTDNILPSHHDDVTATFTVEGLETLSELFSSTLESVIDNSFSEIIEYIVKQKLEGIATQTLGEIRHVSSEVERISQIIENSLTNEKQAPGAAVSQGLPEEDSMTQPVGAELTNDQRLNDRGPNTGESSKENPNDHDTFHLPQLRRQTLEELHEVIKILKSAGSPMKMRELYSLTENVDWGTNPSMKMRKFMSLSYGQIKRVSRGTYQYVEKNNTTSVHG